jgi:hypothetical protein
MSKKSHIFGTVLFLAMFSVYGYAKNSDPAGEPEPGDHPEANLGVSHDDCPGGGVAAAQGAINPDNSGNLGLDITVVNDDCVQEVEVQSGDDKKVNGNEHTTGTVNFPDATTISLNITTEFNDVTLTNANNNVTLSCTQHTVGDFHVDTNVLDATTITVSCNGSGQIQKKRLDDVVLDIFPHL